MAASAAAAGLSAGADRHLIASIGDEDTITGLLLAGTGHVSEKGKKNFLVVDSSQSGQLGREHAAQSDCCPNSKPETSTSTLEAAFNDFTERPDIAILLINQHIAERIRPLMEQYTQAFPAVLEIPSKDHPYDPSKDSVLRRVKKLTGE
ncbi:H(+)-transporting V1 sector ATPase subunit F [Cystobasidiomycetes sp. EMM_F5]